MDTVPLPCDDKQLTPRVLRLTPYVACQLQMHALSIASVPIRTCAIG
jgi:hypothetical protein